MFLNEKDKKYLQERFEKELVNSVDLIMFTRTLDCDYCIETENLLKELSETSDKIKLTIKNAIVDKQDSEKYKVDRVPLIMIGNDRIRYYGIPAGYEFAVIVEDLIEFSRAESFLSPESVQKISNLQKPINIKVFVTPTCPYCPRMAKYAHSAAMVSENITAEVIEASEFPEIASAYSVFAVPKTIINDQIEIEGAVSESHFINELLRAASL